MRLVFKSIGIRLTALQLPESFSLRTFSSLLTEWYSGPNMSIIAPHIPHFHLVPVFSPGLFVRFQVTIQLIDYNSIH